MVIVCCITGYIQLFLGFAFSSSPFSPTVPMFAILLMSLNKHYWLLLWRWWRFIREHRLFSSTGWLVHKSRRHRVIYTLFILWCIQCFPTFLYCFSVYKQFFTNTCGFLRLLKICFNVLPTFNVVTIIQICTFVASMWVGMLSVKDDFSVCWT